MIDPRVWNLAHGKNLVDEEIHGEIEVLFEYIRRHEKARTVQRALSQPCSPTGELENLCTAPALTALGADVGQGYWRPQLPAVEIRTARACSKISISGVVSDGTDGNGAGDGLSSQVVFAFQCSSMSRSRAGKSAAASDPE